MDKSNHQMKSTRRVPNRQRSRKTINPPAEKTNLSASHGGGTLLLIYIGILMIFFTRTRTFWGTYLSTSSSLAWDSSGHLAMLRIYSTTIFPKVFGWTGTYFAGMPFPNFYPPLWLWSSAALGHCGVSLNFAAKLVVLASLLLIPPLLGVLASHLCGRRSVGVIGMVIAWLPLAANAMRPSYAGGLTLVSTFEAGIYTEPLGVLLLVLTLIALDRVKSWSSEVFASALLAGVLLSNVFAAIAAIPMLLSYSVRDLSWSSLRRVGVIAGSALAVSAFWWVPLARAYWTVVTMPLNPPFNHVINPEQALWLTIGLVCNGICLTRGPRNQRWFHYGLFLLCITAFLSYVPGLEALPLQLPRFVEIIIFLIAVPIAITVDRALLASGSWWRKGKAFWELTAWQRSCSMVLAGILIGALVRPMPLVNQLYTPVEIADLQPVLDFARTHTNGKYLVQTPHDTKERYSARALSSYLGAQGNESALTVYREDSTGALFYVPLSDIVSGFTSTFGISSSRIGDKELLNEPGERLLRQLNYMRCGSSSSRHRTNSTARPFTVQTRLWRAAGISTNCLRLYLRWWRG